MKFGITLFIVCACMLYYVLWRLFTIFHNNAKIIPLIISIILALVLALTFMYQGDNKVIDIVGTISTRIFVLGFILTVLLSIEHLISIRYKINPRIIVGIIIIIFGLGAYFSLHTKTTYLNIETNKVHKDTTILLVSDIHAENVTQNFHMNKILKTIEQEKPDFVVIAGDLMNKPNTGYIKYFSAFKSVKDIPIFAVMGNHDVMGNTKIVKDIPNNSRIIFLNNEKLEINGIQLIGIIDKSLWGNNSISNIMDQINLDKNSDLFSILITHQPISLEKLKDYPIDLEVAGHTHRGQFYGMRKIVEWLNDYAYGEYKLGDRTAFVTQGIGTWGLPFRLGTQSEIVIINIKRK